MDFSGKSWYFPYSLLEGAVALGPTKLEHLGVIPHKRRAVARVARPRAEEARLNAHGGPSPRGGQG